MEAAQRLEIIRAKAGHPLAVPFKAAGVHRTAKLDLSPRPSKGPRYRPKGFGWVHPGYGGYTGIREQPVSWVAKAEKEPEKPLVAPKKRRKGKHYLSEIVEKMPGKLPKITET